MKDIMAPQSVQRQLEPGERIVAEYGSPAADYYATDRRLLRFTSRSAYEALDYSQIVSITRRSPGIGWSLARMVLALLGLFCIVFGFLFVAMLGGIALLSAPFVFWLPSLSFWLLGATILGLWMWFRVAYYQIEASGLERRSLRKWRIWVNRWGGADKFAQEVGNRSKLARKEKPL